jgi:signal transduction histidine kinase
LLDEVNKRALHALPGKKIDFVKHIRYEGNIDIDVGRLTRAIAAVIDNAIDAMPDGGVITFTTDEVVLRLSDTGGGISPEILPTLFEPFEQTKSDGAGAGLALAKAIVEAHGGKLSVGTVPGKGTTVDIRLPKPASE